jgi:disulfide bond formation protein DsbB
MAPVFFALLALTALVGSLLLLVLQLSTRRNPDGPAAGFLDEVAPAALPLAAVVATTSMIGSLYFSEVLHFAPCELCWYQRIAMYPLAPMLGIAAVRRDLGVRRYAWVLSVSGALIAAYHYTIEWLPNLEVSACSTDVPCTAVWFREFGFVSIAFMALSGFIAITILLHVATRVRATDSEETPVKEVVQ